MTTSLGLEKESYLPFVASMAVASATGARAAVPFSNNY